MVNFRATGGNEWTLASLVRGKGEGGKAFSARCYYFQSQGSSWHKKAEENKKQGLIFGLAEGVHHRKKLLLHVCGEPWSTCLLQPASTSLCSYCLWIPDQKGVVIWSWCNKCQPSTRSRYQRVDQGYESKPIVITRGDKNGAQYIQGRDVQAATSCYIRT